MSIFFHAFLYFVKKPQQHEELLYRLVKESLSTAQIDQPPFNTINSQEQGH